VRTVAVLAVDGVSIFELGTPIEVFGRTVLPDGSPGYEVWVAGPRSTATTRHLTIGVDHPLDRLVRADMVIVPGRDDPTVALEPSVVRALQDAARHGARIVSICVGAFDLASAGLLDGLRVATHWHASDLLASRHPAVDVDETALWTDHGQIVCGAGAAAGLDVCLELVRQDHGAAVAAQTARMAVVPLTREAGQAQYVRVDKLGATELSTTLEWIQRHASEPLTVEAIAQFAAVSTRTLNRRFADELGTTPSRWLSRIRVREAQRLLETTTWSMARVARESGLGTAQNLRSRFGEVVGTSPARYRIAFSEHPQTALAPHRSNG
jgi:transcriptional regulator GlxA family with amidase domain